MAKRELIDTGNDKRYVRRDDQGRFKEVTDVGRSLSQERRREANNTTTHGQGARGDRPSYRIKGGRQVGDGPSRDQPGHGF